MKLRRRTLNALAFIITGESPTGYSDPVSPYRTRREIVDFFDEFDDTDPRASEVDFFDEFDDTDPRASEGESDNWRDARSRMEVARIALNSPRFSQSLKSIISEALDSMHYDASSFSRREALDYIVPYLRKDGLQLHLSADRSVEIVDLSQELKPEKSQAPDASRSSGGVDPTLGQPRGEQTSSTAGGQRDFHSGGSNLDSSRKTKFACVVVATDTEWRQLKRVFAANSDLLSVDVQLGARQVVLAKAPEMGMAAASTLTTRLIHEHRPSVIAMCGVAGGIGDAVKLGHLVVATHTWNYARGKHKNGKFEVEIRQRTMSKDLERQLASNASLIRHLASLCTDQEAPNPRPEFAFGLHLGSMVTGSAVVADDETRASFEAQSRKILAVDMEAYGVMYAATYALDTPTSVFVTKAVSDYANPNKDRDGDYQDYCAWLSAHAVKWVLEKYSRG